uniref:Uncharacterized protein n=1 Tax=Arundo donax TaxID=35708 RepID=A0A0A9H3E3_ARUDO
MTGITQYTIPSFLLLILRINLCQKILRINFKQSSPYCSRKEEINSLSLKRFHVDIFYLLM